MNNKNPQKGFTILVAVVTAGILLIIAMSIGGIALKEQVLSAANKESQIAFYAADTGMECALYLDLKIGAFAYDADGNPLDSVPRGDCGGSTIWPVLNPIGPPGNGTNIKSEYSYTFEVSKIQVGEAGGTQTCAIVVITKDTNDSNSPACSDLTGSALQECVSRTHTTIKAYGYNTCYPSLTRLERGVEGHY